MAIYTAEGSGLVAFSGTTSITTIKNAIGLGGLTFSGAYNYEIDVAFISKYDAVIEGLNPTDYFPLGDPINQPVYNAIQGREHGNSLQADSAYYSRHSLLSLNSGLGSSMLYDYRAEPSRTNINQVAQTIATAPNGFTVNVHIQSLTGLLNINTGCVSFSTGAASKAPFMIGYMWKWNTSNYSIYFRGVEIVSNFTSSRALVTVSVGGAPTDNPRFVTIYVNGEKVYSGWRTSTATDSVAYATIGAAIYSGQTNGDNDNFPGYISNVSIFDRVLTEEETITIASSQGFVLGSGGYIHSGSANIVNNCAATIYPVPELTGGVVFSGISDGVLASPTNNKGSGGIYFNGITSIESRSYLLAKDVINVAIYAVKIDPYIIYDSIRIITSTYKYTELAQYARDNLDLNNKSISSIIWRISESLQFNTPASSYKLIDALATDIVALVATLITDMTFANKSLDNINVSDINIQFLQLISLDNISLNDIVIQLVAQILRALSSVTLQDESTHIVNIWCIAPDSLNFEGKVISQHELRQIAQDSLLFVGLIDSDTKDQVTYVLNSLTKGLSTYEDFDFNSSSGNLLCKSSGIYKREKSLPVEWKIKTGLSDLGSEKQKQVPYIYLGLTNEGDLVLKTITDLNGSKKEVWYKNIQTKDSYDTTRVQLGKGIKSKYWQFELMGEGTVELDSIELMPLELSRRV